MQQQPQFDFVIIFGILTYTQHKQLHEGCTNTVKQSVQKIDSGRKSLAALGSWTCVSSTLDPTLSQMSNIPAPLSSYNSSGPDHGHACNAHLEEPVAHLRGHSWGLRWRHIGEVCREVADVQVVLYSGLHRGWDLLFCQVVPVQTLKSAHWLECLCTCGKQVCVAPCIYVCVHTYTNAWTNMHIHVSTRTCTHLHIHASTHTRTHTHTHIRQFTNKVLFVLS